jgi:hypothetical protein
LQSHLHKSHRQTSTTARHSKVSRVWPRADDRAPQHTRLHLKRRSATARASLSPPHLYQVVSKCPNNTHSSRSNGSRPATCRPPPGRQWNLAAASTHQMHQASIDPQNQAPMVGLTRARTTAALCGSKPRQNSKSTSVRVIANRFRRLVGLVPAPLMVAMVAAA